jgi:hypothetical protein
MKIKLSKFQWEFIGAKTGWLKTATLFGPQMWESLGTEDWKEKFGPPVTTDIMVAGSPLVMSGQIGEDGVVVIVEHKGQHVGVYDPKNQGFRCTYTKDIDQYASYKDAIDQKAKLVLDAFVSAYRAKP